MKLIFASFQGINNKNVPEGMTRLIVPILKYFDIYRYYVSYGNKNNQYIKNISWINILVRKIISRLCKKFNFHSGIIRLAQEYVYDFFLSLKIKEPVILFSTAYIPRSAIKNKKFGGINIFLAGNPYDRYISDILKKEKKKYSIEFDDPYTYERRLIFLDIFLKEQDHIIAQTSITYESFSKNIFNQKLSLQQINIVPNFNQFSNNKIKKVKKMRFVYLAHTVWLKGLLYLIEAFNKIKSDNCELVIAGNINPIVLKSLPKQQNKNIIFRGPLASENLNSFYKTAHVCIVPSLVDDHPATISEALYCGLPVITTEGCGAKILIKNEENGFIVPRANSKVLASKIEWFLDNKCKIKQMSRNAQESIMSIVNSDQNKLLADHILKVIEKIKDEKGIN